MGGEGFVSLERGEQKALAKTSLGTDYRSLRPREPRVVTDQQRPSLWKVKQRFNQKYSFIRGGRPVRALKRTGR
jgi:hypothetical protein